MIQVEFKEGMNVITCKFSFSGKAGGFASDGLSNIPEDEQEAWLQMTYLRENEETIDILKKCADHAAAHDDEKEYAVNSTRSSSEHVRGAYKADNGARYHTSKPWLSKHHEVLQGLFLTMCDAANDEGLLLSDTFSAEYDQVVPAVSYMFHELNNFSGKEKAPIHDGLHLCGAYYKDGRETNAMGLSWWMIDLYEDTKCVLSGAVRSTTEELLEQDDDFENYGDIVKKSFPKPELEDLDSGFDLFEQEDLDVVCYNENAMKNSFSTGFKKIVAQTKQEILIASVQPTDILVPDDIYYDDLQRVVINRRKHKPS